MSQAYDCGLSAQTKLNNVDFPAPFGPSRPTICPSGTEKLITLTSVLIILKLDNFNIEIKGTNLVITKMMPSEILIKGKIKNVGFNYE